MNAAVTERRLREFYEAVFTGASATLQAKLDKFLTADATEDRHFGGNGLPLEWTAEGLGELLRAFSELQINPRRIAVLDGCACVEWTGAGTAQTSFAGLKAGTKAQFRGFDAVVVGADGQFTRHCGWIDATSLTQLEADELDHTEPRLNAVEATLLSGGRALEQVASRRSDRESQHGWNLDVDAPRWALGESGKTWLPAVLLAAVGGLLGVGLLLLLWAEIGEPDTSQLVAGALAIGGWAAVAILAITGWRVSVIGPRLDRLQVRLKRSAGERDDETPSGQRKSAPAATKSAPETETANASSSRAGPIAKEPVLAGSALFAAGVLAIGLSTPLGGDAMAAIAAGGSAVVALLLRQQTTPEADPKDPQGKPLVPEKSPAVPASK